MNEFESLINEAVNNYIKSDSFLRDVEKSFSKTMKKQPSKRLQKNIRAERVGDGIEVWSYSKPNKSIIPNYPYWQNPEYAWDMWNEEGRIFDLEQWNRDDQPYSGVHPKPDKYYKRLSAKGFDGDQFYSLLLDNITDEIVVYGFKRLTSDILSQYSF